MSIRAKLRRARRNVGQRMRDLRWLQHVSSPNIDRYIDWHLRLDGYYWLFVLGINNSGTTLLSHLLESHPSIRSLPREAQRYTRALPRPSDVGLGRQWGTRLSLFRMTEEDDPSLARRCRFDWAFCYAGRPGAILHKSPPNTVRSRWLQRHFRPNRFLALTRNPYAVCEGIRRRTGCSIEQAAVHWTRTNGCLVEDMPHLDCCLRLSYEQFCNDPETSLQQLDAFLDLGKTLDRRLLRRSYDVHNLHGSAVRGLKNFNAESMTRLSASDIDTITRIAEAVMVPLGYDPVRATQAMCG